MIFTNVFKKIIERIYLSFSDNLVYYDSVTHCKTRYYYDHVVKSKYQKKECCIVYVDINNLKKTNDSLGHYQGTKLIKSVSEKLLLLDNVYDVCRVGGDEFVSICDVKFDKSTLKTINDISYGIAFKECYEDVSSAVRKADEQMYEMKKLNSLR